MDLVSDNIADAAEEAASRIDDIILETPLRRSAAFSDATGAEVFFKLENQQHTGSFKLRGAANCLMTLSAKQRAAGCVAASSGNHGAAVAYAMRELGVDGVIFVPEHTSPAKIEAIRSYGGDVRFFGTDGLDTEQHALADLGGYAGIVAGSLEDSEVHHRIHSDDASEIMPPPWMPSRASRRRSGPLRFQRRSPG